MSRSTPSDWITPATLDAVTCAGQQLVHHRHRVTRERGVGPCLLTAVETACTTDKLFTSTHVSNHPMRHLLRRVGRRPVGLLHGLDEEGPELLHRCPSTRLPAAAGTGGRRTTR
ncbi:hypothetical protein [Streptomyces paromomycinus]|uniref:hypothetical protein n=1 Tax=Streptomyces paromomycinus TaxID=92743 RepID=UPI000F62102E|nr:hypothetical protein [Streptomyces paromomycinus]